MDYFQQTQSQKLFYDEISKYVMKEVPDLAYNM